MINQLPMPSELSHLAVEGYAKYGRGFVRWISEKDTQELGKYYPAKDCNIFRLEPYGEYLQHLVQIYDPIVEFVLFINIESQGRRSHLYPRLLPLLGIK
jgi:hypothetical protein